jgi:hypothetical protein
VRYFCDTFENYDTEIPKTRKFLSSVSHWLKDHLLVECLRTCSFSTVVPPHMSLSTSTTVEQSLLGTSIVAHKIPSVEALVKFPTQDVTGTAKWRRTR